MFMQDLINENKKKSFEHYVVVWKKQNKDTISVNGNKYSYITKKGVLKEFIVFNTFNEYKNSELYPNKAEKVNGFYFVPVT